MTPPVLEARRISKAFPGVQALADVSVALRAGEVLAMVGENGAGKSTLMKVLAGVLLPDSGEICVDSQPVSITSVHQAEQLGITLIHQELNLADNLDVAGNLFLGREPTWGGPLRLLDRRRIYGEAQQILAPLGWTEPGSTPVAALSPGRRQLVEVGRALARRSRVLIMDEPTSSLSGHETERLFSLIRQLARSGVSILYISHRLREVEAIAGRVVVLRDGRNAGELTPPEIRHDAMVRLMVGRDLKQLFERQPSEHVTTKLLLEVAGLPKTADLGSAGFSVRRGEIVGLAGLVGAGRTELAQTLFGLRRSTDISIRLGGKPYRPRDPADAIAAGVLLVPEDRRLQGLILADTVKHNIALSNLDRLSWLRLVLWRRERDLAREQCDRLNVKTPSLSQSVSLLSGGNQQKVVLAKWLPRTPLVLVLDEPTRGVDVAGKAEIYDLMARLSGSGMAILMISSDLEEIIRMSDRVVVMHEGAIAGELAGKLVTEQNIMHLATGGAALP